MRAIASRESGTTSCGTGRGSSCSVTKAEAPPPLRLARKQMPVRMRARKAEKEIALPHGAAVRAQRNDLRIPDQSLS